MYKYQGSHGQWTKLHKEENRKEEFKKFSNETNKINKKAIWENEMLEKVINAEALRRFNIIKSKKLKQLEEKKLANLYF